MYSRRVLAGVAGLPYLLGSAPAFPPHPAGARSARRILYSEWLPQGQQAATDFRNRDQLVGTLGSYVAARVRSLSLGVDPSADLNKEGRNGGLRLLADALSQAYRDKVTAALKRTRLRERLARSGSPCLTLIDGKMQPVEWIHGPTGLLKTDFDHHGLGKPQLNVTDPPMILPKLSFAGISRRRRKAPFWLAT